MMRRGLSKPTWPYTLNRGSRQAVSLKLLYADAAYGGHMMRDVGGRYNHGVLATNSGALPTWSSGKDGGGAISFSGSSGNRVSPPPFGIAGNVPVTMTAWAKFANTASDYEIVANFGQDLANQEYFIYREPGGKAVTETGALGGAATSTTTLVAGKWYHLAAVYNGANNKIYVNGVLEATTTYSVANFSDTIATFGSYLNAGVYKLQMTGLLDEVRIYTRALSANEIWAIYDPRTRWELRWQAGAVFVSRSGTSPGFFSKLAGERASKAGRSGLAG